MSEHLMYLACFRELEKSAGFGTRAATWAAGHAAQVGGAVKSFAHDVGSSALGTVRPSAWKAGIQAGRAEMKNGPLAAGMTALAVPLTAADVVHTMRTKVDPATGRQLGLGERAAVAAGHVGSTVAGMRYMNMAGGGFVRGIGVQVGGGMITDAVTSRAGRAVDSLAARRSPSAVGALGGYAHPATAAGGAPVARGVS
jgi:hypothetical protein